MKPVYKAADGTEHETPEAAKKRNAIQKAAGELDSAARALTRLMAESALTADGVYFEVVGGWRNYWRIADCYGSVPQLVQVSLWPHDLHVDMDHADAKLVVRWYEHADRGRDGRYYSFRVCELYADERKAKAALVKACEKRLAEFQEEVADIKKTVQ